jgi:hypothetical protein
MAQHVIVVDDLTGDVGAHTRRLRVDGVEYDIDLTEDSFAKLKDVLRPFLEVARVVPMGSAESGRRGTPVRKAQQIPSPSATIRAWAAANGVTCPARGRIPASVVEAFESAR